MFGRVLLPCIVFAAIAPAFAIADDPPAVVKVPSLAAQVTAACEKIVADALAGSDYAAGAHQARELLLRVLAWEKLSDAVAVRRAVGTYRLLSHLHQFSAGFPEEANDLAKWMVKQKSLVRTFPLALTKHDRPPEVYRTLDALRKLSGKAVTEFPDLATAVCVVHDRPFKRRINENRRVAPKAEDVFKFFASNDSKMLWGVKKVPWELQVWTVDVTSPVKELKWALRKFKGDKAVGKLFFKIKYDTDHYRKGTPKKVNRAGYNLPNILKHGGICADQAYFATEVGKAIGCPSAYTVGRGLHGGHAWVGFLQGRRGKAVWNFKYGRYKTHKYFRGTVLDPQTRQRVPDSVVSLLADTLSAGGGGRRAAQAYVAAAGIVLDMKGQKLADERLPMPTTAGEIDKRGRRETARKGGGDLALELVKASISQCSAHRYSWTFVRDMAGRGELTAEHMRQWSDALIKETGKKYPDFSFDILMPMVESIEEAKARSSVFSKMFKFFRKRPDLASDILLAHGRLWEAEGEKKKALALYKESISKFLTDGPMVLKSLDHIEKLLAGRGEKTWLSILAKTFKALKKPNEFYNLKDSMWHKVGTRYSTALRAAGKDKQARKVEKYVNRGGK